MLEGQFAAELRLQPSQVSVSDLAELQVGQILPLTHSVEDPGNLLIGEREMFKAYPVACGAMRGAQIVLRNSIIPVSRKVAQ
jgi:flagellar motor switch protein FliM